MTANTENDTFVMAGFLFPNPKPANHVSYISHHDLEEIIPLSEEGKVSNVQTIEKEGSKLYLVINPIPARK